jgi:hypothetical protein
MASLSEERSALSRDRQAFAVRETQLAAFISGLGLRVPAPAPGAATTLPSARSAPVTVAPTLTDAATSVATRDGGARTTLAPVYVPLEAVAQRQLALLKADAAAIASARRGSG